MSKIAQYMSDYLSGYCLDDIRMFWDEGYPCELCQALYDFLHQITGCNFICSSNTIHMDEFEITVENSYIAITSFFDLTHKIISPKENMYEGLYQILTTLGVDLKDDPCTGAEAQDFQQIDGDRWIE